MAHYVQPTVQGSASDESLSPASSVSDTYHHPAPDPPTKIPAARHGHTGESTGDGRGPVHHSLVPQTAPQRNPDTQFQHTSQPPVPSSSAQVYNPLPMYNMSHAGHYTGYMTHPQPPPPPPPRQPPPPLRQPRSPSPPPSNLGASQWPHGPQPYGMGTHHPRQNHHHHAYPPLTPQLPYYANPWPNPHHYNPNGFNPPYENRIPHADSNARLPQTHLYPVYYPFHYPFPAAPPTQPAPSLVDNTSPPPPPPDLEKLRLETELEAFKKLQAQAKAEEKQRELEAQIRLDTEKVIMKRMEDMRRAQEEAKQEIELAKREAERVVTEKLQAERKAQMQLELERERAASDHVQRLEAEIRENLRNEAELLKSMREAEVAEARRVEKLHRTTMEETIQYLRELVSIAAEKVILPIENDGEDTKRIIIKDLAQVAEVTIARSVEDDLSREGPEKMLGYSQHCNGKSENDIQHPIPKSALEPKFDGVDLKPHHGTTEEPIQTEKPGSSDDDFLASSPRQLSDIFSRTSRSLSSASSQSSESDPGDLPEAPEPPNWGQSSSREASTASPGIEGGRRSRPHFQYQWQNEAEDEEPYNQRYAPYHDNYWQQSYHHDEYAQWPVNDIVERIVQTLIFRLQGFQFGSPRYDRAYSTSASSEAERVFPSASDSDAPPQLHSKFSKQTDVFEFRVDSTRASSPSASRATFDHDTPNLLTESENVVRRGNATPEHQTTGDRARSPDSMTHLSTVVQFTSPTHDIDAPSTGSLRTAPSKLWEPPSTKPRQKSAVAMWSRSTSDDA